MFGALRLGFRSLASSECCRRTLNRKEQLRHRAVSLRLHGFLVGILILHEICDKVVDPPNLVSQPTLPCRSNCKTFTVTIQKSSEIMFSPIRLHGVGLCERSGTRAERAEMLRERSGVVSGSRKNSGADRGAGGRGAEIAEWGFNTER